MTLFTLGFLASKLLSACSQDHLLPTDPREQDCMLHLQRSSHIKVILGEIVTGGSSYVKVLPVLHWRELITVEAFVPMWFSLLFTIKGI